MRQDEVYGQNSTADYLFEKKYKLVVSNKGGEGQIKKKRKKKPKQKRKYFFTQCRSFGHATLDIKMSQEFKKQ